MLAALIAPGTLFVYLISDVGGIERWLVLASGVLLIVTLIVNPDGLAESHVRWMQRARRRLGRKRCRAAAGRGLPRARVVEEHLPVPKVAPVELETSGVTVRYGAGIALDDVSLAVRPGRITGLIGANGAGKTTFIDAVSGFTPVASGAILLNGGAIERWSPDHRARAGMARTFQSLELFDDLTVAENLLVATDRLRWWQWAGGLVRPSRDGFPPATSALIEHLGLGPVLDDRPSELSFGTQRLLAVARAAAADPSVILLDEPAAGLDDRETDELGGVLRWLADERGMGILLVEHHVRLVLSVSDDVVAIDFGRVIFSGSAPEASVDAGLRHAYLGAETQAV
jgi:sulfate-transporting ATPase